MKVPRVITALALIGSATPSVLAEQQASIHIKVSSGTQLRGNVKSGFFGQGMQTCHVMDWYNFGDFKYACQWDHGAVNGYNLFFMRSVDDSVVWECACDNHLGSYDPWDLNVWTWTGEDGVACYSRDGLTYDVVAPKFDAFSCDTRHLKNCDSHKPMGECAYFDRGGEYLVDDNDGRHRPN